MMMRRLSSDHKAVQECFVINIEGAEVCVVARTEEDCTKLEGKKVDSCPASQNQE